MPRIKVVTFHSEGPPHDYGLPLIDCMAEMRVVVEQQGLEFDAYTPRRLRELNAGTLSKRYDDKYMLPKNAGYHLIGMGAWKPFVILHALESMDEGDIVIYSDVNLVKYEGLKKRLERAAEFSEEALGDFPFFVGRYQPDERSRTAHHASARQILDIGSNSVFSCNFPTHIANRFVVRACPQTRQLLEYWLALCMQEKFVLPPIAGHGTHPNYYWFCAEQSVLNLMLANLVEEGNLPYYFAGVGFSREGERFLAGNSHVKHLVSPQLRDGYVPFATRFANEIDEARLFMAERLPRSNNSRLELLSA